MSATVLRRLSAVLGALVALWLLTSISSRLRQDGLDRLRLPGVDTAAVDTMTLTRGADTVRIARDGARWTVNGRRADSLRVRELLRVLADTAATGELVAQSAASHPALGVGADSGRRLRVLSRGKALLELTVGNRTSDYSGLHVRPDSGDAVYALRSTIGVSVADVLTRGPDDWRDRTIGGVTPDSVMAVELRRGPRTTTLRRATGRWTINGVGADSSAVATLLEAYRSVTASGFPSRAQEDSARRARPRASATLRGARGVLLSLSFDSAAAGVWVRSRGDSTVYRLDGWQLGRLMPADSSLRRR